MVVSILAYHPSWPSPSTFGIQILHRYLGDGAPTTCVPCRSARLAINALAAPLDGTVLDLSQEQEQR